MTELEAALAAIIADARGAVAAGREPNTDALRARLAAVVREARAAGADAREVDKASARALRRLETIASVHRAKARVERDPRSAAIPAPGRPVRQPALKTTPTITGTLDVRRAEGEAYRLVWDADPKVTEWEVRFSERPDVRSDYVDGESFVFAAGETAVDVPLGDLPFRVNVLGRGRNGKLQRRALISGLTREGWRSRWQRRASAS
jgi:hypothetical protein